MYVYILRTKDHERNYFITVWKLSTGLNDTPFPHTSLEKFTVAYQDTQWCVYHT